MMNDVHTSCRTRQLFVLPVGQLLHVETDWHLSKVFRNNTQNNAEGSQNTEKINIQQSYANYDCVKINIKLI